jgi:hypothetical protein
MRLDAPPAALMQALVWCPESEVRFIPRLVRERTSDIAAM